MDGVDLYVGGFMISVANPSGCSLAKNTRVVLMIFVPAFRFTASGRLGFVCGWFHYISVATCSGCSLVMNTRVS